MEFAGGLSPCRARFGNLYFYVVPVAVTRAHIHSGACATLRRPVFFITFFRATRSRPTWHFVHSDLQLLLSIERLEIAGRRSYSNGSSSTTRSYSYWQMMLTMLCYVRDNVTMNHCFFIRNKICIGISIKIQLFFFNAILLLVLQGKIPSFKLYQQITCNKYNFPRSTPYNGIIFLKFTIFTILFCRQTYLGSAMFCRIREEMNIPVCERSKI